MMRAAVQELPFGGRAVTVTLVGGVLLIKILHTADIHLDSPMKSLALRDADLAATVQAATRGAFLRIVEIAISEDVAAVLIAGDLFDGAERSAKTGAFLVSQLDRLAAAGIQVFYIKGNHDAENPVSGDTMWPDNVHLFDGRGGKAQIGDHDIWVHGVSFSGRYAPESLLPKFGAPVAGAVNIGMLHTSLAGAAGHDPYAPCSVAELRATGFDYWALGHVHKREVHSDAPWIVMPGIPQGRDIGEPGPKSATMITVADGVLGIAAVPTSRVEFLAVDVDVSGCDDAAEVRTRVRRALEQTADALASQSGLVRVTLRGATDLSWRIVRDPALWHETVADLARGTGVLWLEKLKLDLTEAATTSGGQATEELAGLMAGILEDDAVVAQLQAEVEAMIGTLPTGVKSRMLPDAETARGLTRAVAETGAAQVLARMKGAAE
jgi:exonuclease SbcD